jgi:hypothetical protein
MNRKPRQISPKQAPNQNRRVTRKVAALPKGAKEVLGKGAKGKVIPLSPSQRSAQPYCCALVRTRSRKVSGGIAAGDEADYRNR